MYLTEERTTAGVIRLTRCRRCDADMLALPTSQVSDLAPFCKVCTRRGHATPEHE